MDGLDSHCRWDNSSAVRLWFSKCINYFKRKEKTCTKSSIQVENSSKRSHEIIKIRDETRRRQWHPTPVLLPGKSYGRRRLVGCSLWGRANSWIWLSDFTFTFHFHALEKEMATHSSVLAWRIPGTGEPWWAAVYRVAQSRTKLKQLNSNSSSRDETEQLRNKRIRDLALKISSLLASLIKEKLEPRKRTTWPLKYLK